MVDKFIEFVEKYRLVTILFLLGFCFGTLPFLLMGRAFLLAFYCFVQIGVCVTLLICIWSENGKKRITKEDRK